MHMRRTHLLSGSRQQLGKESCPGCRERSAGHGLSQQGVWVPFWTCTQTLKKNPSGHLIFLCGIK